MGLFPGSLSCPQPSDQKEGMEEAWPQLRLGLRKGGQRWLLVAQWSDAGVSLPLYVWEVEDQPENIPEPSPADIRITIEEQVQYNQSL